MGVLLKELEMETIPAYATTRDHVNYDPRPRIVSSDEMTDTVPFIDAHHHLWDLDQFRYAWLEGNGTESETSYLGDYSAIRANYLIDDLLDDYAGLNVAKSVHVQADFSGPDPVVETRWLQSISDQYGYPHAIVGYSDLTSEGVEAELDRHLRSPNMRGIRMVASGKLMESTPFRRGFAALAERGLSFDLFVDWDDLEKIQDLIQDFPSVQFIVTHTGDPYERSAEYFQFWRTGMSSLAKNPHVSVKISGLGMRDWAWTLESFRPWILETIELFGVSRCMFATNWPVDRLYSDLATLVGAYRAIVEPFTRDEQESLLWRNAERHYRI